MKYEWKFAGYSRKKFAFLSIDSITHPDLKLNEMPRTGTANLRGLWGEMQTPALHC